MGLGVDTGETIYDCNSTNAESSRQCGGDALNTIIDAGTAAAPVFKDGSAPSKFLTGSGTVKAINDLTTGEAGEDEFSAPSSSVSLTGPGYVCISLLQSSYTATTYLQPAAHTSYYQPATTTPLQSSNNIGASLQGGASSSSYFGDRGGHISLSTEGPTGTISW